jgi:hypothetical protein
VKIQRYVPILQALQKIFENNSWFQEKFQAIYIIRTPSHIIPTIKFPCIRIGLVGKTETPFAFPAEALLNININIEILQKFFDIQALTLGSDEITSAFQLLEGVEKIIRENHSVLENFIDCRILSSDFDIEVFSETEFVSVSRISLQGVLLE